MTYGYMETPNIPRGLAILRRQGFSFDIMATSCSLPLDPARRAVGHAPLQDRVYETEPSTTKKKKIALYLTSSIPGRR